VTPEGETIPFASPAGEHCEMHESDKIAQEQGHSPYTPQVIQVGPSGLLPEMPASSLFYPANEEMNSIVTID
jgi:hypothetical protein